MSKCEDCNSQQKLSQKFINELTLGRLVGIIVFLISVAYGCGAGTTRLYNSMTQTQSNKTAIDSILTVTSGLYTNTKAIVDYLEHGGHIPEYLTIKEITKDSNFAIADNTIYPRDDEEEDQRTCIKLTKKK